MRIKQKIKSNLTRIVPKAIRWEIEKSLNLINQKHEAAPFLNISFSQEGEDLILYNLIGHKANGFYIDIGAHHPYRFSNTYKFYLLGWRGINIDPLPGSMQLFDEKRPGDINLEMAILNDDKPLTYYMFNEPAFNTFDAASAMERDSESECKIKDTLTIKPYRLAGIIKKNLPEGMAIDFFSIDAEKMDIEVLKSNDWDLYRPGFIVTENVNTKIKEDLHSEVAVFLASKDYELVAKSVNSLFFKRK